MLLKPKNIEPGSTKRWLREAIALAGGSFHLWFAVMLALTAAAVGIAMLPLSSSLHLFLGIFAVKLSQEIAVRSEHGQATASQLMDMVRAAADACIPELQRNKLVVAILIGISAARMLTDGGAAVADPLPPNATLFDMLFNWSALENAGRIYTFGLIAAFHPSIGGILVHPLQRMHDLSYDQAHHLVEVGGRQNIRAIGGLDATVFLSGILGLLFAPFLLPFLLVIGPAMSYVACREMFGPGGKMQTKESTSTFKPALES